jgi:outer membrane protein TolC
MSTRKTTLIGTLVSVTVALLSGCANAPWQQTQQRINSETSVEFVLARDAQTIDARRAQANQLLRSELSQAQAVQLALLNSAQLQALLAYGWQETTAAAQAGRIANPVLNFERLVSGDAVELSRGLGLQLLDVITLPWRAREARLRVDAKQLQLAAQLITQISMIRMNWVRAVAAQQRLVYAKQVMESAQASAELAKRMEGAGNFNRLSRAREHSFYAEAAARVVIAQQQALATREALIRDLGLRTDQHQQLKLPARLPDLPKLAIQPTEISARALTERLDVRIASLEASASARAQGHRWLGTLAELEVARRAESTRDSPDASANKARGYELDLHLPIFDWGGLQRAAMSARTLAAANQLDAQITNAASELREHYGGYRAALDLALHYRDEIVPLRKTISDENMLRYNGMLISVFELLADARQQVETVSAAIGSAEQFWLAEAALQAALLGADSANASLSMPSTSAAEAVKH